MNVEIAAPTPCAAGAPIGVFDSGVGGLSVVRELLRQMPERQIIYLADQVNAPYGRLSLAEIRTLAGGIARFLLDQGACVIVIACNTASAAALHALRRENPQTPFVGMEPAVKPAAERTKTRHVGVIATPATFQGELFASLLTRYAADVAVHTQVCPDLVPLVEAGDLDSDRARRAVTGYLAPLLAAGIDELVLGCTHYPFLRPLMAEAVGPTVEIIDPAPAVARQTARLVTPAQPTAPNRALPQHRFFTTGDPQHFGRLLHQLLGIRAAVHQAAWTAPDRLVAVPPKSS